jgi:glycosyltransferase involved in cell wall biosynthesis
VRALLVTSVHQPDDPRIRERTLTALAEEFEVRYAVRSPGPSRGGDHELVELKGGRVRRWWGALRQMLRRDVDVISLHDPELIPAGLLARLIRRVPVVVDVHEDVPAQIRHKPWRLRFLRVPAAWLARFFLRLAERFCVITLAELGYRRLFRHDHPVFPNYPAAGALPDLASDGGYVVYAGDITEQRGAVEMVEAVGAMENPLPLLLVGRCRPGLARQLEAVAAEWGVVLTFTGLLSHPEAMTEVASASAGLSLLRDLPNYQESLPTKVIEYLALGIPVVASDLPGTRAAVEGMKAVILVNPGDTEAAALALDTATSDLRPAAAEQAAVVRESRVWPAAEVGAVYLAAIGKDS